MTNSQTNEATMMIREWPQWQEPSRDHVLRRLKQIGAPVDADTELCVEDTQTNDRGALTPEEDARYGLLLDAAAALGEHVQIYVWSARPCDVAHSGFVRRLAIFGRGRERKYLRLDVDPIAKLEGLKS